jgi:uncharacterized damage-inducible protein DinB
MDELQRIRDQIIRALDSDAWHGPSLMEVLAGLTAEAASARPIPDAHSIWEILLHVTATVNLVIYRLKGEARVLSDEEDWPQPSACDDSAWEKDVDELRQAHMRLLDELSRDVHRDLDQPIVEGFSSVYVTLHGLVQHNLCHAGQIALLKKAILGNQ